MDKEPVIAVDIGSSRTHIAAVDVNNFSCSGKTVFHNLDFEYNFTPAIKYLMSTHKGICEIKVTSCSREMTRKASVLCEREGLFGCRVHLVKTDPRLPVSFNYDPENLGSDRVCDALACAAMFKGQDSVIIDSGTATTVDYLSGGGKFIGGTILPGPSMQLKALHRGTRSLPHIKLNGDGRHPVKPLGTSTETGILAGVLYGTAGAIERIVSEYLLINKNATPRIVTTGGGWRFVEPYLKTELEVNYIQDLTLIGAALYMSPA